MEQEGIERPALPQAGQKVTAPIGAVESTLISCFLSIIIHLNKLEFLRGDNMFLYSIIMFLAAAPMIKISIAIYKGKTSLIHDYHQTKVVDKAAYGKAFGKAMLVISMSLLLSGIIGLFGDAEATAICSVAILQGNNIAKAKVKQTILLKFIFVHCLNVIVACICICTANATAHKMCRNNCGYANFNFVTV